MRVGDLSGARLRELTQSMAVVGVRAVAISAIRRSVIDPVEGVYNLAYSHRTIDAAAALGIPIVSIGLHRPLAPNQRGVQWFCDGTRPGR